MPFPVNTPKQTPCPHWNHFPIQPSMQVFGSITGCSPPTNSFMYCKICRAAQHNKH